MTEDQPGACSAARLSGPVHGPEPDLAGAPATRPFPSAGCRQTPCFWAGEGPLPLSFLGEMLSLGWETPLLSRPHGLTHPSELLTLLGS